MKYNSFSKSSIFLSLLFKENELYETNKTTIFSYSHNLLKTLFIKSKHRFKNLIIFVKAL